jgi:hypothetical protein
VNFKYIDLRNTKPKLRAELRERKRRRHKKSIPRRYRRELNSVDEAQHLALLLARSLL